MTTRKLARATQRAYLRLLRAGLTPRKARRVLAEAREAARVLLAGGRL